MDALADAECWLLADDRLEWRQLMINLLRTHYNAFCALIEPALFSAPR